MWETNEQGKNRTDIWLTPKPVLDDLGPFDLDPCAAPEPRPWPTAAQMWTEADDGLSRPWSGLVWLNPPYSRAEPWLARMAGHNAGIALLFARTETRSFFEHVWRAAGGVLFVRGRIRFCRPDGVPARTGMGPSVLAGYGEEALRRLARSKIDGHLVVSSATVLVTEAGAPVGTWKEAVQAAMAGRQMRLRDVYAAAEGTRRVREAKAAGHDWKAQLRRALQVYCQPVSYGVWRPA